MAGLSLFSLQITGGLACLVATWLAWWVAELRLPADGTHYISEALAVCWRQRASATRLPGFWGSLVASMLFGTGALGFGLAAVVALRGGWSVGAACSAATGALLLAVVAVPLREVPPDRIMTARGLDLVHPLLAALFYLVALVAAVVVAWPNAGPIGTVLVLLHVVSSVALSSAVLLLSPRALGGAAFQPWYLPGVRILLDRRPAAVTPTEWVRRLQWPATILIALDLGLTPTGL